MNKLTCSCGAAIDTGAHAPGTKLRCPKCKTLLPVPPASPPRKPPTRRVAAVPGHTARKAAPNRTVLLASAAGLIVLVVALVFALKGNDEPKPNPDERAKKGAEDIRIAHDPKDAKGWLRVAADCRTNGFIKEYEEALLEAAKMGPKDDDVVSAWRKLVEEMLGKLDPKHRDYADQYYAIAERVEAAGLEKLAMDLFEQIAGDHLPERLTKVRGISPKHPKANKKLGNVLTDFGTYEPEDLWNDIKGKLADMSKRDGILKNLKPWNRKAFLKKEDIEKRIGGKMKFKVVDQKPYLVAVQESGAYAPELLADDYRKLVEELYNVFRDEYCAKFGLEKVFETDDTAEVLPIIVYDSRETYIEQNPDMPDWAGGHYSTTSGEIEVFRKAGDLNYDTIFHEGAHQLVGAATKALGAEDTNTHWLSEGIACYFGAFKRDDRFQIHLGAVSDEYLGEVQMFARKGKHLPFEKFVARRYGEFVREQAEIEDPVRQQLFVSLSYGQAWAFVYFLKNYENGKYRDKFDEYFRAELKGQGSMQVFTKIFGDVKVLEKEWLAYIQALKPGG